MLLGGLRKRTAWRFYLHILYFNPVLEPFFDKSYPSPMTKLLHQSVSDVWFLFCIFIYPLNPIISYVLRSVYLSFHSTFVCSALSILSLSLHFSCISRQQLHSGQAYSTVRLLELTEPKILSTTKVISFDFSKKHNRKEIYHTCLWFYFLLSPPSLVRSEFRTLHIAASL